MSYSQYDMRLRAVAEQLPAVLWSTDTELRFTHASGGGLAALGLSRGELVGLRLADCFGEGDARHPAIDAHHRALAGESVGIDLEWHGRCFEAHVAPFREGAAIVGTLGMAIDVSERTRGGGHGAGRALRMPLKYELEPVAQLASGLAHEINNPLQSVLNFAQLIGARTDGDVREYAVEILQEVQRIAASVRNLQSFVPPRGAMPSEIRLHEIVGRTLSLFHAAMEKEQIRLEVAVQPDLPPAWAKVHEVQQVLVNLLIAARDAVNGRHPQGGEDKRIRLHAARVERTNGPALRLTIEDHGTAIPPRDLPRVFEPFVVLDGREGSGLGLAISRGLARECGGELSVEGDGRVTRFHLDLPLA